MKPLSQAVTDIINTKFSNKSFSAYDITQAIRSDVNDKKYTITTEFSVSPMKLGDVVTQNIPHSTVKRAVESLYTIGQLTRQVVSHDNYNGRAWYEYTLVPSFVDVTTYPKNGYDSTFAKAGVSGVINNEMIVYNENQFDLTYLVEFE